MANQTPTDFIRQAMPLATRLGIRAEKYAKDEVLLALDWAADLCTAGGVIHGGTIMALADSAGGALAYANLPEGAAGTSTIESKTNFFAAAKAGTLTARARPLHIGGTTIVVETDVSCEGRAIAKVIQTQVILRSR